MSETITAFGLIAVATISGVSAIYAVKSEKNSRPISNGFADDLKRDIRELRLLMIEHIKDHN